MINLVTTGSRKAIAVAMLAGLALPSTAYAGSISGQITDGTGTRALQSAELRILELNRSVETNRDGSYRFNDVPAGKYTLEARYVGAETVQSSVAVPEAGNVAANIVLGGSGGSILVIGQIANQASALSRQRAADGVESVLTRDAIGQFPDQNVAESLRRLPGINILNDQGEGRFVSIRGLDPELNSASINGVRLPAPESDVRSVALDVIPSELIESIEVKKTLTPDMDGDTIGASIEINTTSAFDREKSTIGAKLEGSYNDLTDKLSPKGSIDFSTRLGENVGIAGGLSYYKRKFETDNIEAAGWDESDAGIVFAEEVEYRDYDVERERIGASLSLDFRAGDTTTLYARGLYSQFDDQEYRRRLTFIFDEEPASGDASSAFFTDEDGRIEIRRDVKDRFESQKIRTLTLGGDTETGPWKLSYSASWAKASEKESGSLDPTRFRNRFDGDGLDVLFDYSDEMKPLFEITSGADMFADPSTYGFNKVERTTLSDAQDEEYALKADIARSFAMKGGDFTVQLGAKARWRTKSYNLELDVYDDFDGDYTLADVLGSQTYRIIDINPVPGKTSPTRFFNDNFDQFALDDEDSFIESNSADYSIGEDIYAGYLLGRWDSDTLRVIGGVRMEHTKNDITANALNLDAADEDDILSVTNIKRDYTDWLPSLTVRYEPVRNVVLRAGGYKSLMRPNISKLPPTIKIEDNEGEFGNADLKPYEAWNLDLSAEYYFGRNAAVSAGFFYKDIKNYIVDRVTDDVAFNGIILDEVKQPINGDKAKVTGFEFSYSQAFSFLPEPFDGLLAQLNYTYTDAEGSVLADGDLSDPRTIPLPSTSKHTFNAVLGYEKGPVSLRVAGTYRDKYLDELGDDAGEDRYVADHFQLDVSAKYKLTDNIRIFAEWINITDEPYFAYQNFNSGRRLLQYEEYSWTAKFGVAANF